MHYINDSQKPVTTTQGYI